MADAGNAVVIDAVTGVPAGDWRAAITESCRPLLDAGAVTDRYPARCVELIEEHGPYVVLAPGLALAHARPEDGVKQLCLASATLAEPVEFGHADNDPVDLVLAFGSPDDAQHLGLLQALAEHLLTGLADTLRQSTDREQAIRALERVAHSVEQDAGDGT
ncbi:PTS sugar transporter subunit IIA [Actinobacteria bacterium YIM 96077]|uniref:Ascorbate-specific PTS system EIIA component n=1 Tax=Phytoactinopolyspora halophila TaxID=1981511 RepID=A0A329QPG1_9ACTN|nr:PTS sugar transporter subunit IIA [Phytoactinopolyspora halophila]AYY14566.1 PTS sugar transporter subunit IIA [Actinobacteria bacterium YIM 96077]RAW14056.1 PTS sugar transporter subunit IIA [Phytoactinopolyspora halophila]